MENILFSIWVALILLVNTGDLLFADTVTLKSGKVLECRVLERGQEYLKIEYLGQPLYYENKYVQKVSQDSDAAQEVLKPAPPETKTPLSVEQWSKDVADEKALKNKNSGIKAVISAHPSQGSSPLRVVCDGSKSSSKTGKIVSYYWDFGDGDTADQVKAKNTYLSLSYGPRLYTIKLTVKDNQGNTSSASYPISVINKN